MTTNNARRISSPGVDGRAPHEREFRFIPLASIKPGLIRPVYMIETAEAILGEAGRRTGPSDPSARMLSDHVIDNGLYQPILVRTHPHDATAFEIVDGQHRYEALLRARDAALFDPNGSGRALSMIAAIIVHVDDVTACTMRIATDTVRVRITAWETGNSICSLSVACEDTTSTQRATPMGCRPLAELVGKSPSWCAKHTRLATHITVADLEAAGLARGGELCRDAMNAIPLRDWVHAARQEDCVERQRLLKQYANDAQSSISEYEGINAGGERTQTVDSGNAARKGASDRSRKARSTSRQRRPSTLTYEMAGTLSRFSIECTTPLRELDHESAQAMLHKFSAPSMVCAEQVIAKSGAPTSHMHVPMGNGDVLYFPAGVTSLEKNDFMTAMVELYDRQDGGRDKTAERTTDN